MAQVSFGSTMFVIVIFAVTAILKTDDVVSATFIASSPRFLSKQSRTTTSLAFGLPSFLSPPTPNDDKKGKNTDSKKTESKTDEDKSVGLKGLIQLVMAGAGAPFLGEFEGVEKETGKFMFSLEANNLVDEDGKSKQTSMPYFENGWVDPADLEREEKRKKNGGGFKFPW